MKEKKTRDRKLEKVLAREIAGYVCRELNRPPRFMGKGIIVTKADGKLNGDEK